MVAVGYMDRAPATQGAFVLMIEPLQAMEIMQRLNQETGTAFVFATHDPRVVAFARRVVRMRDGRIEANGAA